MEGELARLRFENEVLKQKQWASKKTLKYTQYFILVDTKRKCDPNDAFDKQFCIDYCDQIMREFADQIQTLVTFNRKTHSWTGEFIKDVKIKYAIEFGLGRLKKDGTRGKSGGTVHIHIYLTIYHHSNIQVTQEALADFFLPRILLHFGTRGFVSRPRLVPLNRIEEYMEKSFQKAIWKTIEI